MPIFSCKCCSYETSKKSSYDKHIQTSKHLKQISSDCTSVVSSITTDDNTKLLELEYQLKLKDMEIKNIINEYTLKLQMKDLELKQKDEIIAILQTTATTKQPNILPNIQPNVDLPNVDLQITEKDCASVASKSSTTKITDKVLNVKLPNAFTIENCYKELLYNDEYNTYITTVNVEDKKCQFAKKHELKQMIIALNLILMSSIYCHHSFKN
jgi:hypothetical protein